MIVLLQNYKYNCPCFYITNKQIDTVFHGEAAKKLAVWMTFRSDSFSFGRSGIQKKSIHKF